MFTTAVIGDKEVAAGLLRLSVTWTATEVGIARTYGVIYLNRVKARASGRPGPRVITGAYRRSIHMRMESMAGNPVAIVGTDAPQAHRLEYGGAGVDSRGRHWHQSPLPHWEPDLAPTGLEMELAMEAALKAELS
jgi:hypothetical protein